MIDTKTIAVSFDGLNLEGRAAAIQSAIAEAVPTNTLISVSVMSSLARWTDEGSDIQGDYSYDRAEEGALLVIVYRDE